VQDKNTTETHECGCGCADCACGKRNRFFRGKRMKAGDFNVEQAYSIERRRIVNRSVIGTGVVNGFLMKKGASDVGPGFALDRHGREIVLAAKTTLGPNNLFVRDEGAGGCRMLPASSAELGRRYLLSVHYAERRFGDVDTGDGCGCGKPEKNYVCETAVFSLTACDPCPCGEEPCHWKCRCGTTDRCGGPMTREPIAREPIEVAGEAEADQMLRRMHELEEVPPPEWWERVPPEVEVVPRRSAGRGPHACVCHRLMGEEVDCSHHALCKWNGYEVDTGDGVALACIVIVDNTDPCQLLGIDVLDPCGPRHLVKSNDLLYDFIRGCDLTHISWVSWWRWHRRRELMPWKLFSHLFYLNLRDSDDPMNGLTAFAVRFSTPVLIDTIRYDSISMRAVTIEQATDWRLIRRIPIVRLDYTPHAAGPFPSGTTDQVRVYVSTDWIRDEIKGRSTWLTWDGFEIEFELDGFGILDCHHQPIDADAIGLEAAPTGNGTPGGIYRSAFRVHAKPARPENAV